MEIKIEKHGIKFFLESPLEEVYIEEILGLKTEGDYVLLVRKGTSGLGQTIYLQTEAPGE